MTKPFQIGDRVIYRKQKHSVHPGPRARNIDPAPRGEYYKYEVDKFWIVADQTSDGKLILRTRRGKQHIVSCDDPNIRKANWWERFFYADRFPKLPEKQAAN